MAMALPTTAGRSARSGERGFTLVEIMLVVSIIALVASFAVPSMQDARRIANETAAIAMVRSVFDGQIQFNRKLGTPSAPYAADLPALEAAGLLPAGLTRVGDEPMYTRTSYQFSSFMDPEDLSLRIHAVPMTIKEGSFSFLCLDDGTIYRKRNPPTIFSDPAQGEPIGK